jgi:hypothetical protein
VDAVGGHDPLEAGEHADLKLFGAEAHVQGVEVPDSVLLLSALGPLQGAAGRDRRGVGGEIDLYPVLAKEPEPSLGVAHVESRGGEEVVAALVEGQQNPCKDAHIMRQGQPGSDG